MRGTVAALAIRDDFALGAQAEPLVRRAQLITRLEAAVGADGVHPVLMHRAGNRTAELRADGLAKIFAFCANVEDLRVLAAESIDDVIDRSENFLARGDTEVRRRNRLGHGR